MSTGAIVGDPRKQLSSLLAFKCDLVKDHLQHRLFFKELLRNIYMSCPQKLSEILA